LNIDIVINILSFGFGALIIYLTAYLKVKGKNKGLIEDINRLESEKQKVIAKYRAETEELKKQHSLDIEKRKYQYEDKRTQFTKYFLALDEYHKRSNELSKEEFEPVLSEYSRSIVNSSEDEQKSALNKYLKESHKFIFKISQEQVKLKSEQHSIRLIASESLNNLLNLFEESVGKATNVNNQILNIMGTEDYHVDKNIVSPFLLEIQRLGQEILDLNKQIREQMNKELDQI
jgi:uncharacterized protein (UPF0335 family)